MYAEVVKKNGENESSIHEIVKKEKEFHASFAVTPQTAEVTATGRVQCLVRMKKALHLWVEDLHRKRVSIDGSV